jgi:hypothetical protein
MDVLDHRWREEQRCRVLGYTMMARIAPFEYARRQDPCPACREIGLLTWLIQHLNDDHRWSREQIADWLEGRFPDMTLEMPS